MNIVIKSVGFKDGKVLGSFIKNKVSKLFRQRTPVFRTF
jgi:hypothetical protein